MHAQQGTGAKKSHQFRLLGTSYNLLQKGGSLDQHHMLRKGASTSQALWSSLLRCTLGLQSRRGLSSAAQSPAAQPACLYAVIGVPKTAGPEELKRAFREASADYVVSGKDRCLW